MNSHYDPEIRAVNLARVLIEVSALIDVDVLNRHEKTCELVYENCPLCFANRSILRLRKLARGAK